MHDDQLYLSLVVTARNDDHGGSLLSRMQAFVNGWIGQCRKHGLSAELIVVDWNPPTDRPPLINALHWPADTQPCDVRFIQVPPEIHQRYRHAEHLPLYQMIAKNVGIRRARGRFVLATNIDILFSDELVRFLAERSLEAGRMYRIDRHDVMSDVPVSGSVEEQMAYCQTHLIRVNAREGTFGISRHGGRLSGERDISDPESGICFGSGWYEVESYSLGEIFRWVSNEAEVSVRVPAGCPMLTLDLEPGPGVNREPFVLELLDAKSQLIANIWVPGRCNVELQLPPTVTRFFLRTVDGGSPVPEDPRILNFRVFSCRWAGAPGGQAAGLVDKRGGEEMASTTGATEPRNDSAEVECGAAEFALRSSQVVVPQPARKLSQRLRGWVEGSVAGDPEKPMAVVLPNWMADAMRAYYLEGGVSGVVRWSLNRYLRPRRLVSAVPPGQDVFASNIVPLCGWYDLECSRAECCRLARNGAEVLVRPPDDGPTCLTMHIEPGPGVNGEAFELLVRVAHDQVIAQKRIRKLQSVEIPLRIQSGQNHLLSFHIEGGDRSQEIDPSAPNFRLFWCGWSASPTTPRTLTQRQLLPDIPRESGLFLGAGWRPVTEDGVEPCFVAEGGGEILTQGGDAEPRVLRIELSPGDVGAFRLEVRGHTGKVVAEGTLRGRQVCYLTLPIRPRTTEVFTLKLLGSDLRVYRLGWADGDGDITEFAAGLRTLTGWSPVTCTHGEVSRVVQGEAELEVTVPGGPSRYLQVELESPTEEVVSCSILDASGKKSVQCSVGPRRMITVEVPWQPGTRAPFRIVAPGARVYHCGWSSCVGEPESAARHFRCEGPSAPSQEDIVGNDIVLGAGWHTAESSEGSVFRWVSHQAEIVIRNNRPLQALRIDLEAGPSLNSASFVLELLDCNWRPIGAFPVCGRQEIQFGLPHQVGEGGSYRLQVNGGGIPNASDPRILDFRVYRMEVNHPEASDSLGSKYEASAHNNGVPTKSGAPVTNTRRPSDSVDAIHLHTNGCGDFTLMAREHWLDLRGYPEFDMYSFHIDSIFCYAAHHGGVREEILKEPMRIYHIEHGAGSGWTPEGQAKLFERLRAKGISWIEYHEVVTWVAQMRKLDSPMIFNRETWGLAEIELPEMRLPPRRALSAAE